MAIEGNHGIRNLSPDVGDNHSCSWDNQAGVKMQEEQRASRQSQETNNVELRLQRTNSILFPSRRSNPFSTQRRRLRVWHDPVTLQAGSPAFASGIFICVLTAEL